MSIWSSSKAVLEALWQGFKGKSVDSIKDELHEMEGAFGLLLFGALTGLPAPPTHLSIALMPYLEHELLIMIYKSSKLDDRFVRWFDIADI